MATYPFLQVDAFTDRPLGGNPCAVLLDSDDLDDDSMLAIAKENNLSETAFVRTSANAHFAARYFTPAVEIPFAGHPTIATVYALIDAGKISLTSEVTRISLELKVGIIPIDIYSSAGMVQRIVMTQNKPQFLTIHDPDRVMPVFGLTPDDLLPGAVIQTVSTGTPQLMLPLKDHASLRKALIYIPHYTELRSRSDFFSSHLFCLQGATSAGHTFARHLDIPPDLPEDPFTGSATGGMAAYLWRYGWLDTPGFIAEQGHWMSRPGHAWVEVLGPREDIQAVKVGGSAVTVLRGTYSL